MRITIFFIAAASVQAFVVTHSQRPATIALQSENGIGMARMFGLVAAVSVFSLSSPPAAMASELPVAAPFASSTVNVAEAIKVLDMGLPSYGDIKESKASVSNVKSLSTEAKGMMASKSKRSSGDDSVEEKKPVVQKQAYTPASKQLYVPRQEKVTPLPTYEF